MHLDMIHSPRVVTCHKSAGQSHFLIELQPSVRTIAISFIFGLDAEGLTQGAGSIQGRQRFAPDVLQMPTSRYGFCALCHVDFGTPFSRSAPWAARADDCVLGSIEGITVGQGTRCAPQCSKGAAETAIH